MKLKVSSYPKDPAGSVLVEVALVFIHMLHYYHFSFWPFKSIGKEKGNKGYFMPLFYLLVLRHLLLENIQVRQSILGIEIFHTQCKEYHSVSWHTTKTILSLSIPFLHICSPGGEVRTFYTTLPSSNKIYPTDVNSNLLKMLL